MGHKLWVVFAGAVVVIAGLSGCSSHWSRTAPGPASASSSTSASASPASEVTAIIDVVAVSSAGQPVNGYRETTTGEPVAGQADCTEPSPAAVSPNIYRCYPSAYGADVCWPASGLDLLCMNDPWTTELHRIRASAPLPPVSAPALPTPVALQLDDGTRCRLRNGGAWGHRYDDLRAFYGCGDHPGIDVLAPMDSDPIDRSSPLWTVKVGSDEARDPSSPPPATHRVHTAWFASN